MTQPLFTPQECREQIIRPSLQLIGLWSEAAEDLLLGTAIQESRLTFTRQIGGGPALGVWQMEQATFDDCWESYLRYRNELARKIGTLSIPGWMPMSWPSWPHFGQLETNHKFACAMARVKYLRSPEPLPDYGDLAGYAHAWKQIYNTAGGAGTEQEFIDHWNEAIGAQNA